MIAVPRSEEGLRRAIGEAYRRYTRQVNFREAWRAHLWQGRFSSFPMDQMEALRHHERTGRPLGGEGFVAKLEKGLGRIFHRRKPGPK